MGAHYRSVFAAGVFAGFHACDIRDEEAVKNTVQAVIAVHGRIDALVNNAGGQYLWPLDKISAKGWDAVIATNLTGGFLMARDGFHRAVVPKVFQDNSTPSPSGRGQG